MDIDISKLKLDNKIHNIEFLLKDNIFEILALKSYSCTDLSQAYIPWVNSNESSPYIEPCQENNYADLSFINNGTYYNFKACRIKSFKAIPMDGNILTYADNTINHNNFIVFYSIKPNEADKILVIDTETYDFLVSQNQYPKIKYFDCDYIEKIRKVFGLKEEWISLIDYTQEKKIEDEYEKNIRIKKIHCLITLNKIKKYKAENKNKLIWNRTHYGNQYSAFNVLTGEMRQFRDCKARNNFFKSRNIKLPNDHVINRNCKNMDKIVKNKKSDNYKVNLNKNGWIITSYIADHKKLANFIMELIIILHNKSHKLAKRIKEMGIKSKKNILIIVNSAYHKIKKLKQKLNKIIKYPRPLSLFEYVTQNQNLNINNYLLKHSYVK